MDRLRWDNIARAAAVVAVIALIVAWPHLKGRSPQLPPAAARPVTVEDPALPAAPAPRATRPHPRAKPARRHSRPHPRRRTHDVRARVRPAPPTASAPAPPSAAPVPPPEPPPAPAPTASDLAAHEFAVP